MPLKKKNYRLHYYIDCYEDRNWFKDYYDFKADNDTDARKKVRQFLENCKTSNEERVLYGKKQNKPYQFL